MINAYITTVLDNGYEFSTRILSFEFNMFISNLFINKLQQIFWHFMAVGTIVFYSYVLCNGFSRIYWYIDCKT